VGESEASVTAVLASAASADGTGMFFQAEPSHRFKYENSPVPVHADVPHACQSDHELPWPEELTRSDHTPSAAGYFVETCQPGLLIAALATVALAEETGRYPAAAARTQRPATPIVRRMSSPLSAGKSGR